MKKIFLSFSFAFLLVSNLLSQDTSQINNSIIDENTIWQVVEISPEFVGGQQAMFQFLSEQIKYPEEAIKKNKEGKVYVSFIVEQDGRISNAVVKRGIGNGCDEEAIRVINSMPSWKPGMQDGKTVRVQFILPIHFRLK